MANNLSVILNSAFAQVLNTVDSTTRVNSSLGNPTLSASQTFYRYFVPIPAGGFLFNTFGNAWVVYLRNLGGIGGSPSGNINVRFQVVGGANIAEADAPILLPGGVFLYWNTTETAGGIVTLTLKASVDQTPVEMLLAS